MKQVRTENMTKGQTFKSNIVLPLDMIKTGRRTLVLLKLHETLTQIHGIETIPL